jgi:hypothetical protein
VASSSYQLSAKAISDLTSSDQVFSEEAFNGYIHIINQGIKDRYEHDIVLDTITTSLILANIYNPERVREIILKRNGLTSLDSYQNIVFPIVDISNKGSV